MRTKALFILLGVYVLLFVFTTIHAYMASQNLMTAHVGETDSILGAEVMAAHLEYVAQATAQTEIALGALIGAMSAALTVMAGSGKQGDQDAPPATTNGDE